MVVVVVDDRAQAVVVVDDWAPRKPRLEAILLCTPSRSSSAFGGRAEVLIARALRAHALSSSAARHFILLCEQRYGRSALIF